jgi:hypothetical protein
MRQTQPKKGFGGSRRHSELREEEPFVTVTLTLLCDIASRIVTGHISEFFGVSQFWSILEAVPELREQEPFIDISKTEDDMYYYWPYHEARYKSQIQDYAKQILAKYGAK